MSNVQHYLGVPIWQIIATLIILALLDPLVWMNTVQIEKLRLKAFNFVAYLLCCAITISALYVAINLTSGKADLALIYTAQIFWSSALLRMILTYELPRVLKTTIAAIILGAVIFNILEGYGILNALDKIDLAMGFKPAVTAEPHTAPTPTSTNLGNFFGFRDKIYVKPSQLLLFSAYFVNIALPLHYFGTSYRLYRASSARKREHIHDDALVKAIAVFSIIVATMVSFILCGADIFQIGIVTAILGAGFSIAAKELVSNFAAGVVLMWDNSIKRGDVITIEGLGYGWVEETSMRYTKIVDRNEMNILIPNLNLINSRIENWTQTNNLVRLKLDIDVAYGTNLKQALEIMMDSCYHVPRVLRQPRRPNALVFATKDSGIRLQLRFWINDPKQGIRNVMSDVYLYLLDKFEQADPKIEVPYNQLEIRRIRPDIVRPA